jgi:hypothetical protein
LVVFSFCCSGARIGYGGEGGSAATAAARLRSGGGSGVPAPSRDGYPKGKGKEGGPRERGGEEELLRLCVCVWGLGESVQPGCAVAAPIVFAAAIKTAEEAQEKAASPAEAAPPSVHCG